MKFSLVLLLIAVAAITYADVVEKANDEEIGEPELYQKKGHVKHVNHKVHHDVHHEVNHLVHNRKPVVHAKGHLHKGHHGHGVVLGHHSHASFPYEESAEESNEEHSNEPELYQKKGHVKHVNHKVHHDVHHEVNHLVHNRKPVVHGKGHLHKGHHGHGVVLGHHGHASFPYEESAEESDEEESNEPELYQKKGHVKHVNHKVHHDVHHKVNHVVHNQKPIIHSKGHLHKGHHGHGVVLGHHGHGAFPYEETAEESDEEESNEPELYQKKGHVKHVNHKVHHDVHHEVNHLVHNRKPVVHGKGHLHKGHHGHGVVLGHHGHASFPYEESAEESDEEESNEPELYQKKGHVKHVNHKVHHDVHHKVNHVVHNQKPIVHSKGHLHKGHHGHGVVLGDYHGFHGI